MRSCGLKQNVLRPAVLSFLLLVGVVCGAHAESLPVVSGARIGLHPDSTRLVFELDRNLPYKIFTLSNPYRVVIDLPEVTWKVPQERMNASVGIVSGFRFGLFQPGNSRVVVDINAPALVKQHFGFMNLDICWLPRHLVCGGLRCGTAQCAVCQLAGLCPPTAAAAGETPNA